MRRLALVAFAAALAGCGRGATDPTPVLASIVVAAPGASGAGFGDPTRATDGVHGAGATAGSLDVYSLDYATRTELVLGWGGRAVHDGPGPDLAVFENAFDITGGLRFMDPVVVSVSRDGSTFVELPRAYLAADPTAYSRRPEDWQGFAGRTPVLLDDASNPVDPFGPSAGGDAFDLADLAGLGPEADAILRDGFRFLRLVPAAVVTDPATGAPYPRDPVSDGPDIDGVYARWVD